MKRTNKLWLVSFLVLLVAAMVAVGLTAAAEGEPEIVLQEYIGENQAPVRCTLDSEGCLTISGEGPMMDFDFDWSSFAWCSCREQVKKAVIEPGVTRIGLAAFFNCSNLESVTIPGTVELIRDGAFRGCASLKTVTMEAGVQTIESGAFAQSGLKDVYYSSGEAQWNQITVSGDNATLQNAAIHYNVVDWGYCGGEGDGTNLVWTLDNAGTLTISGMGSMMDYSAIANAPWWKHRLEIQTVIIESNVTSIGDYAFYSCSSITSVMISDSVTSIGNLAFFHCTGLTEFVVGDGNPAFSTDTFGCLYNKDKTVLIQYPAGNARESFVIPDSVTSIGIDAFAYCAALTSVTIPNSVTSIGQSAFLSCHALASVTIPNSVTSIGQSAFSSCAALTNVTIPDSVTSIGQSTFSSCHALTSVTIPGSVTKIGLFAFEGCASLKSVYIPEGVTIIDDCAFQYCWSLNSVYIPASVEQIGWESFDLSPLKDVFYAGIRSQNSIWFGENNTSLLRAKWHYNVFAGGYCGDEGDGTSLVWTLDNAGILTISGTGAMADYTDSDPAPWMGYFTAPDAAITVVLEEGVTRIGSKAFPASEGLKELIVLNRTCDLSALVINEPAFLRGYLGSTAEAYGNVHNKESLFMPLCDEDYHHEAVWKVEHDDEEDPARHIQGVYCTVCDEYIYARRFEHEWSDWTITKQPTTEEEGEETRTCSVCEKTETRTVEKLQSDENNENNNTNNTDNTQKGSRLLKWIQNASAGIVRWFKKLLSFFNKK